MKTEILASLVLINYVPVVAAIFGGILGFASSYYLYRRQRKTQKNNLRLALKSELETTAVFFDTWAERVKESDEIPPPPIVSTVIFENNTDKIGNLTYEELEAVVDYYSFIIGFENTSTNITDGKATNPYEGEMVNAAINLRQKALRKLNENLESD